MRKTILISVFLILILIMAKFLNSETNAEKEYIIIAWNDLGMHCSNKDFSTIAVLPPYNNLMAQVIKRGNGSDIKPQIITSGVKVTYEIPGNTYSVGKTNFWAYAKKLFGVELAPNIGLKGLGLTGDMSKNGDHFIAEGIPVTPYTDDNLQNEDPYQLALVKVYDLEGKLLASASPVIPVSNEISCVSAGCHDSEQDILDEHEDEDGFDPNKKPILCASCHASNALGTTGVGEAGPFSYRIHNKHSEKTSDCYKCHPGPKTQCLRDIMFSSGKTCADCHGSMKEVASSIMKGRRPWLDEPSCDKAGCHSSDYAPEKGKLYRQSKGHGGLFCSACHGSPHAIYPTVQPRDNQQMIDLQGFSGNLSECKVCHTKTPEGIGPHGIFSYDVKENANNLVLCVYPNPVSEYLFINSTEISGKFECFTVDGKIMPLNYSQQRQEDSFIRLNVGAFPKGVYFLRNGKNLWKFEKL